MTIMQKQTLTKAHKKPAKTRQKTIRCLITGFDSFGSFASNPSQEIVQLLPSEYKIPRTSTVLQIETLVLPTCCVKSWRLIEKQLGRQHLDVLIMIGMAGTRDSLSLERFALNIRDYGMKDNSGHEWNDSPIHKGEAQALKTDLPLVPIRNALRKRNFSTNISNHAGSFICNEVYYQALRYQARSKKLGTVLFLHVPTQANYARTMARANHTDIQSVKSTAKRKEIALQTMADAVLEIAIFCGKS
jgi:pyroglutamyl-peptidase